MSLAERQRRHARRAFRVSLVICVGAVVFFVIRDEFTSALIAGSLVFAWGYFDYRRRLRDIDMIDEGTTEDPFEKRERFR